MKKYIGLAIAGFIIIGGIWYGLARLIDAASEKHAASALAEILATEDNSNGDLARDILKEKSPPDILPKLATSFKSADNGCKIRIIDVLSKYDSDGAQKILLDAFADTDVLVSSHAALVLAEKGWTEVLEISRERSRSDDIEIRAINYQVIANFDDSIISTIDTALSGIDTELQVKILPALLPFVKKDNSTAWALLKRGLTSRLPEVRIASLKNAVSLGGEKRTDALKFAIQASDPDLRHEAFKIIVMSEDLADYTGSLKLALNDIRTDVVLTVSWGLLKLRDPEPVAKLRTLLKNVDVSTEDKTIAARILARMGAPDGVGPMNDILNSIDLPKNIRLEAAEVLAEYGEQQGLIFLDESTRPENEPELRIQAVTLFGVADDSNTAPVLHDLASDPDPMVAVRAAYVLCSLGDKRGMRYLRRHLKAEDPEIRTIAAVGTLTEGNVVRITMGEAYGNFS